MNGKDYFLDYKITVRVLSSVKMDRVTHKLSLRGWDLSGGVTFCRFFPCRNCILREDVSCLQKNSS